MNTNLTSESEKRLSATLQEWVADAPLPPRFQEQVWNRIARSEATASSSMWSRVLQRLGQAVSRPKMAYSYAAVLLALGIAAGSWTAHVQTSRLETHLGERYLQAVDPYQHTLASR